MTNNIPAVQNSDPALQLMRARERTYGLATTLQIIQLIAAVVVPTTLAIVAVNVPDLRAGFATISIGLLLLDVFLIDRALAYHLRRAAKFAEQYDCHVLQLPWNSFIADKKPDPEDVVSAANAYSRSERAQKKIRNWYPVAVGRAPLHIARLVCQFVNLRYDVKLRRRYALSLCLLPVLVVIAVFAAWPNLPYQDVVLSILVPATTPTVWALRELFRQIDAATAQDRIKGNVDNVWDASGAMTPTECTAKSREIQDAIYLRRVSSPLIFPVVYHMLRKKMEQQMNLGTEQRLAAAGYPAPPAAG